MVSVFLFVALTQKCNILKSNFRSDIRARIFLVKSSVERCSQLIPNIGLSECLQKTFLTKTTKIPVFQIRCEDLCDSSVDFVVG